MYEVEVKVPAARDPVRAALRAAGAERVGTVEQVDSYYDAPHRDFAETDEALRVRIETGVDDGSDDGTALLTYKGPLVDEDSKTREERETALADADAASAILESLGFAPAAVVRKERERWRLDGYLVGLDRVDGLGEFVEVETRAGDGAVDPARDGAFAVLRRLGLDPADQVRESYLSMLLG